MKQACNETRQSEKEKDKQSAGSVALPSAFTGQDIFEHSTCVL